jgi:glycine/D-amino acid oxidase-like deaminating enzyme
MSQLQPDPRAWWLAEALTTEGAVQACPPLTGRTEADVAIVGGGFTGLWTAIALRQRRPDLSVVLVEADICGAGASAKNGGKVHGYWGGLPGITAAIGDDAALAVAHAGTRAQDGLRRFALECGRDVWWRDGPSLRIATTPAQEAKLSHHLETARRLGVSQMATLLEPAEVQARCASPVFRKAVMFEEGATVHPGRLVRAMRAEALAVGTAIHEGTPMTGLDRGRPNRLRTPVGEIVAREVVLATNAALASLPELRPYLTLFSSYALMTDPAPDALDAIGWHGDEGLADARMFVHYFRRTPDGRVLMGSGSGPIAFDGREDAPGMRFDLAATQRAEAGLRYLLPGLRSVGIAGAWGGPIDMAPDRLPMFGTLPGTRIHYGCGYSGHGVNATYIGGQCLASLVLGAKDDWATLPFCTRSPPRMPPELLRYLGGRLIRWGILSCEDAEQRGGRASAPARAAAAVPRLLGLRIGTR